MSLLEVHETISGHSRIDFDKKLVRKAMRKFGAEIRKDARRRVSRRAISVPGEYPGRTTGALFKSIQSKVSKSGFLVRIWPEKTAAMTAFYPAFLFYGVKKEGGAIQRLAPGEGLGKSNRRRRGERAKLVSDRKSSNNFVVKPRANYMTDALAARDGAIRIGLRNMLQDALKPR